jgi:hypothetical protein
MCSTFLVNKHHPIETYIGHDDKAVHILGPITRFECVVSFSSWPNILPNKEPNTPTKDESD